MNAVTLTLVPDRQGPPLLVTNLIKGGQLSANRSILSVLDRAAIQGIWPGDQALSVVVTPNSRETMRVLRQRGILH